MPAPALTSQLLIFSTCAYQMYLLTTTTQSPSFSTLILTDELKCVFFVVLTGSWQVKAKMLFFVLTMTRAGPPMQPVLSKLGQEIVTCGISFPQPRTPTASRSLS